MAEDKRLTLRRNFSWTLVGSVIFAACQWGMLVILARLGSPEMVGELALGLALTAPVILFANLKLRAVQATDAKHEYLFSEYLGLRLLTTPLALLIIAAITLVSGISWKVALVVIAVGLAKAIDAISDVIYGLLQQHERMDRIAISETVKGLLSLVAFGIGVYATGEVLWGVVGWIIAWALVLCGYDIRYAWSTLHSSSYSLKALAPQAIGRESKLRPRWRSRTLVKLAWLTLPLGLTVTIGSLSLNIPRYFIEYYLGERDLGIFAAMAYLLVAGNLLIDALGQSATPRLARYYANENGAAFSMLLAKLMALAALLGIMGVLIVVVVGPQILNILYGPEYAEYSDVLVWIMVAAGVRYAYHFLGTAVSAMRRFRIQLPIHFLSLIALISLSPFLIGRYGILGASWVILAAAIVEVLAYAFVLYGVLRLLKKPAT